MGHVPGRARDPGLAAGSGAVRDVAAAAADAGVDVVPVDAEIRVRGTVSTDVLPDCEDIA
ncbi:hypothetical protein ACIGWV_41375 [Streptomyces sp. NPDC055082]|uniref:hypothetical protein n=1 Tax=Streptomyces sp. NPDC055082 TaxID=3365718 RepID=UPI0037D69EDF